VAQNVPEDLREFLSEIWACSESLRALLSRNEAIPQEPFQELAGTFTRLLNLILKKYVDLTAPDKDNARPLILYWRQLQGYLIFLLRFPEILQVPHHSEINQTLDFIVQRDILLKERYVPLANQEKSLFSGSFRGELERCLGKRSRLTYESES